MRLPTPAGPAGSRAGGAAGRSNLIAIAAMSASMAGFTINDSIVKLVAEELALSQIIFVRGMLVNVGTLALIFATGAWPGLARAAQGAVLARGVTDVFSTYLFLTALLHMPLANATAVVNAAPLVLTAMSVVLLREAVGGRRWGAIAVGFAGVMLVAQPGGTGFNAYAFLVLATTVSLGFRDILTRFIDPATPSLVVTLTASVLVSAVSGGHMLWTGAWQPIAPAQIALLVGAAAMVFVGLHFTVVAVRTGDVSVVAPFRYSAILWGLLMGYLFWSDLPNPLAFAGIALIVASGVYLFHREFVTGRRVVTKVAGQ